MTLFRLTSFQVVFKRASNFSVGPVPSRQRIQSFCVSASNMAAADSTSKRSKKLVMCCDGTWQNSLSSSTKSIFMPWRALFRSKNKSPVDVPSNVTRITRAIKPVDKDLRPQIIYYQNGVGTTGSLLDRLIAGATGSGLAENVREAYSFIATNYVQGDEIFLIGFSRGAYTARAVGGLIGDFGLLNRDGLNHFFDIFMDWNQTGKDGYESQLMQNDPTFKITAKASDTKAWLAAYKAELIRVGYAVNFEPVIQAIGVWDTVGALGIPLNPLLQRLGLPWHIREYRFWDTSLTNTVKHAFQALALDEKRGAFYPTVWEKPDGVQTYLKQTWFPGVHLNVGGGFADTGISDITLAWMMAQLAPFLDFDDAFLRKQVDDNVRLLQQQKTPPAAIQWAASALHNSFSGALFLLGSRVRVPGRYCRFNRKADRVDDSQPLKDTSEYVHFSVRSRIKTGGLDERKKIQPYAPKALADFSLLENDAEPGKAVWNYKGNAKLFEGRQLAEDKLGDYEKELRDAYLAVTNKL